MRVNDLEVTFNVFKAIKYSNNVEECYRVDEVFLGNCSSDPLENDKSHEVVKIKEADSTRTFEMKG